MAWVYNFYILGVVFIAMNLDWINEEIPKLPRGNWLYKIMCFMLLKKRLTYKEYMMVMYEMNKKVLGDHRAKEKSINRAMEIYKWLNGKLPDMGEEDDEQ